MNTSTQIPPAPAVPDDCLSLPLPPDPDAADLVDELRELVAITTSSPSQERSGYEIIDQMLSNSPVFDPEVVKAFREVAPEICPVEIEESSILERSSVADWELRRSLAELQIDPPTYQRLIDLIATHGNLCLLNGIRTGLLAAPATASRKNAGRRPRS
jgi:hypothetical protein